MPTLTLLALLPIALCAIAPAILFLFNLRRYRAPNTGKRVPDTVAVLIPARNEEANIRPCIESVLQSRDISFEIWVCDDNSTDRTAAIVADLAAENPHIHLVHAPPLPPGWNGKQHACWKLARSANAAALLLFLDADVRLHPWTLTRSARALRNRNVQLLSGFPRQVFSGVLDRLLLPLIHFILLSYLPLRSMQRSTRPQFAAGCGQFLLVDRSAYFASGGHVEIRESRHDGLRLPQLFRTHGYRTDLVDLTRLADVRMYTTAAETWNGLAKNATEGMAAPGRILPFTLLLALGQIIPTLLVMLTLGELAFALPLLLHHTYIFGISDPTLLIAVASFMGASLLASYLPRLIAVRRFKQPLWSALLHPLGVTVLLCLQWQAFIRQKQNRPIAWRDRSYSTDTGQELN